MLRKTVLRVKVRHASFLVMVIPPSSVALLYVSKGVLPIQQELNFQDGRSPNVWCGRCAIDYMRSPGVKEHKEEYS